MGLVDRILDRWEALGYRNVSMNLWHGTHLYVNIQGEEPFYYLITAPRGKGRSYPVHSEKLMARPLFSDARQIGRILWAERKQIRDAFEEGVYYTRKSR